MGEALDRPEARLLIRIVDPTLEPLLNQVRRDAAVGQHAQLPGTEGTRLDVVFAGTPQARGGLAAFIDLVDGQLNLDGGGTHA